ncbi:MAG: WD40/YVTN/BNR-like repeat-containing protein, partial [Sediminibacterium sp.]
GGQQESGSVGIASRGNDGQITFREWHPVGVEEYGYVAADPLDPNIIYGGKITRYDKRTGQTQNIAPEVVRSGKYRFLRTAPVVFSPIDPTTLYFAGNVIFKTKTGGQKWEVISPDLSREVWDIPASVGIYTTEELKKMPRRGVVYTVAPSYKDINTIWAGTDDGLIHVTKDGGKKWTNTTPAAITSWSKISLIEASHFDVNTAFAAVNRIRCDDMQPYIYKTNDGGKTWKLIVNGLPTNGPINAVREDPVRKGLIFAGSENAVYVSFDEGEHWQSLRLNMPATSIRDLVIKDDDLVLGTHGRGFWILDDITPLRQLTTTSLQTQLFQPQTAIRVRWNMNTDTPLPQEEPAGSNPPDGAIINYFLADDAKGGVKLEIKDAQGNSIRTYSSNDTLYTIPKSNTPDYWIREQQILSGKAGAHRFLWDMHHTPLNEPAAYPIAAIYKNTAPDFTSPWVMPGVYTATLTVNGKTFSKQFRVKMDPRVKTPLAALQQQYNLSLTCYQSKIKIEALLKTTTDATKLAALRKLQFGFSSVLNILQDADVAPTSQAAEAVNALLIELKKY